MGGSASRWAILICIVMLTAGCSLQQRAIRSVADSLGDGGGSAFVAETDLPLVEGALPFSLKAMEALLAKAPDSRGLYLALAQGYMLYGYACAELPAEDVRQTDYDRYRRQRDRARVFYRRALEYARSGLMCRRGAPALPAQVRTAADLQAFDQPLDVAFLYWCGAALAKWITLSKTDPAAIIRLPEAELYMRQAAAIDPDYDCGAIHEFFISYEARGNAGPGGRDRARQHYARALELADGRKLSPIVAWLEAVVIPDQDLAAFDRLVRQVRAFDPAQYPAFALANQLSRERARQLERARADLFLGAQ